MRLCVCMWSKPDRIHLKTSANGPGNGISPMDHRFEGMTGQPMIGFKDEVGSGKLYRSLI